MTTEEKQALVKDVLRIVQSTEGRTLDADVDKLEELFKAAFKKKTEQRVERAGSDRQERGGRNRSE